MFSSQVTLLQKLAAFQRGRHPRPEGQRVWCSARGFPMCFCARSMRCCGKPHDDDIAASLRSSSASQRFAFLFSGHQGREGGSDRLGPPSPVVCNTRCSSQTPQSPGVGWMQPEGFPLIIWRLIFKKTNLMSRLKFYTHHFQYRWAGNNQW